MEYDDSLEQASKKMSLSINKLQEWNISSDPINFALAYGYISQNRSLTKFIDQKLAADETLDKDFLNELFYFNFLDEKFFNHMQITKLDKALKNLQSSCDYPSKSLQGFIKELDHAEQELVLNKPTKAKVVIIQLQNVIKEFKNKQMMFLNKLNLINDKSILLRQELNSFNRNLFIDSLTGLFTSKGLNQYIKSVSKNTIVNQATCILINFAADKLINSTNKEISDAVLYKVTDKITAYVQSSGIHSRIGFNKFLVLLPNIKRQIAQEIAIQIQQGVEKIRFKSSKQDISLPKINLSLNILEMSPRENIEDFAARAQQ